MIRYIQTKQTETDIRTQSILNHIDGLIEFFEAVEKVPKWKLFIALVFLGKEVTRALKGISKYQIIGG